MAKESSTSVEVVPSARRLMSSLRDVGYDFVHAVADLVDNSISAKASRVDVTFRFDGENSWLRISDDGEGLDGSSITEAMRFGSERDYDLNDLGRFGLGLKLASLSQCRRLTVASRINKNVHHVEVRQWDVDHVMKKNRWEVLSLGVDDRPEEVIEPLRETTGAVVLWQKLDRVLGYKIPWGNSSKSGFLRLAEELDLHLSMVFHRFLSGETRRRRKLKMTLNGTVLQPWDPFARSEPHTKKCDHRELEVRTDDGRALVGYTAYILPRQDQFSSRQAFDRSAGPQLWNRQQGFYVYRADRMIQSGGWSYLRTIDEHTKYARVALDFEPDADTAFGISVSKTRVILPNDLRESLRVATERLVAAAKKAYKPDIGWSSSAPNPKPPISSTASPKPQETKADGTSSSSAPSFDKDRPTSTAPAEDNSIGDAIEQVAMEIGEKKALTRIKAALRKKKPEVADAIGW